MTSISLPSSPPPLLRYRTTAKTSPASVAAILRPLTFPPATLPCWTPTTILIVHPLSITFSSVSHPFPNNNRRNGTSALLPLGSEGLSIPVQAEFCEMQEVVLFLNIVASCPTRVRTATTSTIGGPKATGGSEHRSHGNEMPPSPGCDPFAILKENPTGVQ